MFKKIIASVISLTTSMSPVLAYAEGYVVRVPVDETAYSPNITTYDFGKVLAGTTPQRMFSLYNMSSKALAFNAPTVLGSAALVSNNCAGTLAPAQSCSFTVALNVAAPGAAAGEVRMSHSGSSTPDVYYVKAAGVTGDSLVTSDQALVSFGDTAVRVPVVRDVTFRNAGGQPVDIMDVTLGEPSSHFIVDPSGCQTALNPNDTCSVKVTFNPQALGLYQSRLKLELGDGSLVTATGLVGNAVQGYPSWSTSQVNFLDVSVGEAATPQSVTLANTGRGSLSISAITTEGDSAFQVASHTCGTSLAAGATCTVNVTVTPPNANVRSGFLQLSASNTTMTVSRIQLYARPVSDKAVLEVLPSQVNFGSVAQGGSSTKSVALRSTGTKPVNVSSYSLAGLHAADYRILNASSCTGALAPGMECVLQVQVNPSAADTRTAVLNMVSDATEGSPSVTLTTSGVIGNLTVAPVNVIFGDVEVGASATQTVEATNTGQAPLTITSLNTAAAAAAGYAVTGCVGQTLAAGSSCTLSVTFTPATSGSKTATATLANTGAQPSLFLNLSGNGLAPVLPAVSMSAFTCPAPAQVNTTFSCTATLRNTGTVAVSVGAPTQSSSSWGAVTSDCPTGAALLAVGASCTVTASAKLATAGSYSNTVTLPTGAGAQVRSASVSVVAPNVQVSVTPHGSVTLGSSNTATHTISNTGAFNVTLTLPPTLSKITAPAGSVGSAISYVSTTCAATLAAGQSCSVTTRFTPDQAGNYTSSLGNAWAFVPASAGSASTSNQLSGTGVAPAVTSADLSLTPNPINFGIWPIGVVAPARAVTIKNNSGRGLTLSNFVTGGTSASEFQVTANTCLAPLANGASCLVTLTATPAVVGVRSAQLNFLVDGQPALAPVQLTVTGVVGALTAAPNPLAFGTQTVNVAKSLSVVLTNTGAVSTKVLDPILVEGTDAAQFKVNNLCAGKTLSPGATCSITVSFTPASTRSATANLRISHNASPTPVLLPMSGAGAAAPAAKGALSAFTCPTPALNEAYTCTATLSSVGELALSLQGLTHTNTAMGSLTHNCPTSILPGASCAVRLYGTAKVAGTTSTQVTVSTNGGTFTQQATLTTEAPSVKLTMAPHGNVQVGASGLATHTLTNQGKVVVSRPTAYATVAGTGFAYVSTTCTSSLGVGASCQFVTRCTPPVAGAMAGTLTAAYTGGLEQGALSCTGVLPAVALVPAGNTAEDVGGHSRSGNWMRLSNNGVGPVTVQGLYPADANWTLFADAANAAHCSVNRVLAPGQSCLVMEVLSTGVPGNSYSGTQRVRTSAGDLTWTSRMNALGVSVRPTSSTGPYQVSASEYIDFTVTNLAPYPLSGMTAQVTGTGLSIVSNGCTALAATGGSGSTCSIRVRVTGPTSALSSNAQLSVSGGYPQVINAVANASVGSGVQGSYSWVMQYQAAKLTWTVGTYPATPVGGSSQTTSYLRNEGTGPVAFTGPVAVTAGPHSIVSSTCTGTLQVGQTCQVVTKYAPSSTVTTATLSAPTAVGLQSATLVGTLMAQGDVTVTVDDGVDVILRGGSTTFKTTVANNSSANVKVVVVFGPSTSGTSIVTTNPPVCSGTPSCVISGSQATMTLGPGVKGVISQTFTVSQASGVITMSASATPSDFVDTNTGNNQASNSTTVSEPVVDLAATISGLPAGSGGAAPVVGAGSTGTLTVAVVNKATGAAATTGQAQLQISALVTSGNPGLTLGTPVCKAVNAGALCGTGTSMTLPPGAAVTYTVPYTVGAGVGSMMVKALVQNTNAAADSQPLNNTATQELSIQLLPQEKWCTFTTKRVGRFLGCYTMSPLSGSCTNGGLLYQGRITGSPSSQHWLYQEIADGWQQVGSVWALDPSTAKWKGTNTPITPVRRSYNGGKTWTELLVLPQILVWQDGRWQGHFENYYNGQNWPATLQVSNTDSRLRLVGSGTLSPWDFFTNGTPFYNYVTEGVGKTDGRNYRQAWIENSPGPNCILPGTVRVQ